MCGLLRRFQATRGCLRSLAGVIRWIGSPHGRTAVVTSLVNLRKTLEQMGVQILEALPQGLTPAGRSVH